MKKLLSLLSVSIVISTLTACGNNTQVLPINVNNVSASSDITPTTIGEQQRQQEKLHDFFFKYYSEGEEAYSISSSNEHLAMLLKAENRINNAKVLLDENLDKKVTWPEVKKFVTSETYILDFRKNIVAFSFTKLDKNNDKSLSIQEFGAFNKEIKAKEVKDYKLDNEFKSIDYEHSNSLSIEEYENFFIKYLRDKLTWRK